VIAIALCDTVASALRLKRALGNRRGLRLGLLVCRRSWLFEARVLGPRSLPAALTLVLQGRLRITRKPIDDPGVLAWLRRQAPDIGLHAMGVIYRKPVIDCFRRGILNSHIGLLPAYRGRSVMEWSLLEGRPTGVTVFFVDEGIDTGSPIVLRKEIGVGRFPDITSAKTHLFSLDAALFAEALDLLDRPGFTPVPNDGSGRRYYVMSRLFSGVVDSILSSKVVPGAAADAMDPQSEGREPASTDASATEATWRSTRM
jgi:folate-dependent phosphoribosylglycinamide formyltransferase PurN